MCRRRTASTFSVEIRSRLTNRSRRRMLGTTPLDTREMALAVATRRRCMRRTRRRRARGIVSILFASDGRVGSNAAFLAQALERAPTPTPSLSVSTLCRRRRDHMPSVCTLEPPLPGPYLSAAVCSARSAHRRHRRRRYHGSSRMPGCAGRAHGL